MAKTAQALCDAGITADGSLGVSRAVQVLPVANTTCTSASVMVFCNPSISTFWPASGSSVRMRQVCTIASPVGCETTGVTVSILPEKNAVNASRASPCIGVLNSTLNSFGASSWTLR